MKEKRAEETARVDDETRVVRVQGEGVKQEGKRGVCERGRWRSREQRQGTDGSAGQLDCTHETLQCHSVVMAVAT